MVLLYEAKRKVFWTGVRFSPPPPEAYSNLYKTERLGSGLVSRDLYDVSQFHHSMFLMGVTRFRQGKE